MGNRSDSLLYGARAGGGGVGVHSANIHWEGDQSQAAMDLTKILVCSRSEA